MKKRRTTPSRPARRAGGPRRSRKTIRPLDPPGSVAFYSNTRYPPPDRQFTATGFSEDHPEDEINRGMEKRRMR